MTKLEFKYFDIQVNGYARIDFNSLQFNSDQADMVYSKLTEDNVEGILATIITDDFDRMIKKINNIVSIINNNKNFKEIVKGLHIEGPFLNPENGYRGAHSEKSIVPANIEMMKQILDASEGLVKLVTLAPECDHDNEVTEYLALQNIVVSAGHSNASIEDLKKAIDKGLKIERLQIYLGMIILLTEYYL